MPPKKTKQEPLVRSYAREAGIGQEKTESTSTSATKYQIVERLISELHPADYNPRKISKSQRASLRDGMTKFGWAGSFAVINIHPERKDIIISGHQRIDIWGNDLKYSTCPCLELNLTEEDERELNIRLNKNGGEFDLDLLGKFFDSEDLVLYGFSANELPSVADLDDEPDAPASELPEDPVYPIVPKFNEKYSMFCIMCSTELDETWLRNVLRVSRMASYKSSSVAPSFVLSCEDFRTAIQDYAAAMNVADPDGEPDDEIEVME